MSFVYARKYNNKISVYADNKITVSPDDESILIKAIGKDDYRKIKLFGIIKNVIINENLCICFAGILEDFNDLLKYVDTKSNYDFDLICKKALEINKSKNNRTDFIICSIKNNDSKIVEIKNNVKLDVESSWVGSKICFEKFQSLRLNSKIDAKKINELESSNEISLLDSNNDRRAFEEVLNLKLDDSVGDFSICCVTENQKFCYLEKLSTHISKERVLKQGEPLNLYDNVYDGGFTYYVYNSSNNYKMYIEQMKTGIVYCPHLSYKKYNHLRIAKLEHCSPFEFEKKYNCGNCSIIMSIPNNSDK